jgi:uncharacterized protein YigE (DUF2233 family)
MHIRVYTALAFLLLPSIFNLQVTGAQDIVAYRCKPSQVHLYWKAADGKPYGSFGRLTAMHKGILFAMNGGMYNADLSPTGLYIEKGKQLRPMRRVHNPGVNFGIQPQGVFGIRNGKAFVETVETYHSKDVVYATQSAPMLVLNGKMNPNLPVGMKLVRNGVGILSNGDVLMAVSTVGVTFPEFADYFIKQGCTMALYLDGNVSEYNTPQHEAWGRFGVLIAVE